MEKLITEIKESVLREIDLLREDVKEVKKEIKEINKIRWKIAGMISLACGAATVIGYLLEKFISKLT